MGKSIGKKPAKNIVRYYFIYKEFLLENRLEDDSNSITVESLINYVESQIDNETRLRLADKFCN